MLQKIVIDHNAIDCRLECLLFLFSSLKLDLCIFYMGIVFFHICPSHDLVYMHYIVYMSLISTATPDLPEKYPDKERESTHPHPDLVEENPFSPSHPSSWYASSVSTKSLSS